MSPEFIDAVRAFVHDPAAATEAEGQLVLGTGETATVFRGADGAAFCALAMETTRLDADASLGLGEALLRLTAETRFSGAPRVASLGPLGESAIALQLDAALVDDPERLERQLDATRRALGDLHGAGAQANEALHATTLMQEAAWLRV
ncbi:MAG TPA: hypothetical protein VEC19_17585 [Usitatibacter sp.]|nr:hypothetical protein [Usitatibacter sp.]